MIKIIVAVDSNFAIGYKNSLLFEIPDDLKRFKDLTTGNTVVQGRLTYESIINKIGKPLPNRLNVVLTRDVSFEVPPNVFLMNSVDKILNHHKTNSENDKDIYIAGGSTTYSQFLPYADEVYLTYIDKAAENADTFFNRKLLEELFYLTKFEKNWCDKNKLDFYYATYKNKNHYVHRVDEFK